jgi:hypothetical protein
MIKKTPFMTILLALLCCFVEASQPAPNHHYKHAIDFCPVSPLFNIFALQYSYSFTSHDQLMLGASYMNIRYGTSYAPGLIIGYKRYLWKGLHAEYQLWPAWNAFYEKNEKQYYKGFELWNEAHLGYTINFKVAGRPCFINLQYLAGCGLLPGNKPESFIRQAEKEPWFFAPIFFVGRKF